MMSGWVSPFPFGPALQCVCLHPADGFLNVVRQDDSSSFRLSQCLLLCARGRETHSHTEEVVLKSEMHLWRRLGHVSASPVMLMRQCSDYLRRVSSCIKGHPPTAGKLSSERKGISQKEQTQYPISTLAQCPVMQKRTAQCDPSVFLPTMDSPHSRPYSALSSVQ